DHKFDPITQEDYYALQAVFAGVGRGDVAYDPDPAVGRKRAELRATLAAIDRNDAYLNDRLDSSTRRKAAAEWETPNRGAGIAWQVPECGKIASERGSVLAKQPDGSIRSEGPRPERDTYTLTARVPAGVTAVRLELLPDDSLPHRGPGRQDNGNLHLSEF